MRVEERSSIVTLDETPKLTNTQCTFENYLNYIEKVVTKDLISDEVVTQNKAQKRNKTSKNYLPLFKVMNVGHLSKYSVNKKDFVKRMKKTMMLNEFL